MRSALAAALCLLLALGTAIAATLSPGTSVRVTSSSGGNINIRSAPEIAKGNVVGQVTSGTLAQVVDVQERDRFPWYRVQIAQIGMQGWVRGDLLVVARTEEAGGAPPTTTGGIDTDLAIPQLAAPTGAADWMHYVPELLPAIDSCLGIVTVKPAIVTRVYQLEREMAGVRVQDRSGRRWECLVRRQGGTPFRYEPLADRVRPLPGDGNPIFTRAPALPPNDPCWRNSEVHDPTSGAVLGTSSYKTC
jgi:hypothetical protein